MEGLTWLILLCWLSWIGNFSMGGTVRNSNIHRNVSDLLDNLLRGYDNSIRPDFGGAPLEVEINIMVRSMGPISEVEMTYSMDMYFRQSWIDRRLSYSSHKATTLALSISMLEKIWKPDTYFYNGRQSYLHTITTPNKFVRLYQDGRVLYSSRLTVKASCPMHLEDFPMDTQRCPLKLGSFGYTTRDVLYRWKADATKPVDIAADMKMSQFDLISTPSGNATDTMKSGERSVLEAWFYLKRHKGYFLLQVYFPCMLLVGVSWVAFWINREATADRVTLGQFSCLLVSFHLQRHMGNFLIQVYGPCTLLVVLSWVSFWLNREATADRVSLGVTTVLTMTFLGLEARTDLPKVAYPTALDFFVFLSYAFIFATIIQFAVVHYFTKKGSGELYFNDTSSSSSSSSEDESEDEHGCKRKHEHGESKNYNAMTTMTMPSESTSSGSMLRASGSGCPSVPEVPFPQMSIIEIPSLPPQILPSTALKCNNNNGSGLGGREEGSGGEDSPSVIPGCPQQPPQRRPPHLHPQHDHDHDHDHRHHRRHRRESTWSFCTKAARKRRDKLRERRRMELENVNSVSKVDTFARIFFPLLFLVINVFYWYYYLYKSSDDDL